MEAMEWAYEVFGDADLGDLRRTERLAQMVSKMADAPECSISEMMGNEAENKGAQRFFGNEAFDYKDVIAPVVENTLSKISQTNRVFLVQDTSHLNYDSRSKTLGLGHIGSTKNKSFQGIMMHWTFALTGEAEPIGIAQLKLWKRAKNPRKKSVNAHQNKPIEKKESYKWIEAFKSLEDQIPPQVQAIWISDRESDIYEFIDVVVKKGQDLVIRANNNRVISNKEKLLKKRARSGDLLGTEIIEVIDENGKKIKVPAQVRSCKVELLVQRRKGGAKSSYKCSNRTINVVHVLAKGPKYNIEWILLTSLAAATLEQSLEVIWIYKQRWHIELVHKTLKSGYQAEALKFNSSDKLEKVIAMMLPCAVRIYWMSHRQKYDPDKPANQILTEMECRILSVRNKKNRNYVPTIKEAWLWIAWMGGFKGSKNSPPPGQITFWRGFAKLKNVALGAEMASTWN